MVYDVPGVPEYSQSPHPPAPRAALLADYIPSQDFGHKWDTRDERWRTLTKAPPPAERLPPSPDYSLKLFMDGTTKNSISLVLAHIYSVT